MGEEHGNLCPECNGCGWADGAEVAPQPWDCPPEWEDQVCPTCGGSGEINDLADEDIV